MNSVLQSAGRSDTAGVSRHRLRSVLVVAQVAGSLVLLIVAGLFVRSLMRAQRAYMGFDADHVLNLTLDPREVGYDDARATTFYRDLETRVRALPGVDSASLAFSVPMGAVQDGGPIYVEGQPPTPGQPPPIVIYNHVDEPYFDTMRVPLLRGRVFREDDNDKAPLVAVVNQTMAQQFWPNRDPLGKRFSLKSATGPFIEVVGLAADGKFIFIGWDKKPYFFVPVAQNFSAYRTLQVRTSLPPEGIIAQMQNEVRALDPNMPVSDADTMRHALAGGNGYFIFQVGAVLAAAMGLLGLTLAVVGVYGVVSFAASQRTHEIGIRMALGAGRRDILRLVLQQGLLLVIAGVLSGVVLAWALTRSMATILVGVSPTDALTYLTATAAARRDWLLGLLRARAPRHATGSDGRAALRIAKQRARRCAAAIPETCCAFRIAGVARRCNKPLERIRYYKLWSYAANHLHTGKDNFMRRLIGIVLPLLLLIPTMTAAQSELPKTPVRPVTEDYFGTKVVDPYRWLENTSDPEVIAWMKAQNDYTRAVLARIPGRDELLARMKSLDNAGNVVSALQVWGGHYFYYKTEPGSDNRKLFTRDTLTSPERLLVDPEKMTTADGKHYSIDYFQPSLDGVYVAYGISLGGSEESVLHVLQSATGKVLPDSIDRAEFASPSWLPDGKSFFYTRAQKLAPDAPPTAKYQKLKVYRHTLGGDPDTEPLVFGFGANSTVNVDENDFHDRALFARRAGIHDWPGDPRRETRN